MNKTTSISDCSVADENANSQAQIISANDIKSSADTKINECIIKKLNEIDSDLLKLAHNPSQMVNLCKEYLNLNIWNSTLIRWLNPGWDFWNNPQACGCSAMAIMQLFITQRTKTTSIPINQSRIAHKLSVNLSRTVFDVFLNQIQKTQKVGIKSFDELCNELQKPTEGVIFIGIKPCKFILGNQNTFFPGHAFTIIKVIADQKIGYRVAQSYLNQYHLKDFLEKKTLIYADFESLKKDIVDPLKSILNKQGSWTELECENYRKVSQVFPKNIIDHHPDTKTHSLDIICDAISYEQKNTITIRFNIKKCINSYFRRPSNQQIQNYNKEFKLPVMSPHYTRYNHMSKSSINKCTRVNPQENSRMGAAVLLGVVALGALAIYASSYGSSKTEYLYR